MSTVIVGAGIIGTSIAYYLSQSETFNGEIHLIEASPQLFASASGYAGGFLARDWFSPPLAKLGQLSFDLHRQLAEEHGGHEKWGYSPSTSASLEESKGAANGADWLRQGASRSTVAAKSGSGEGDRPVWLKRRSELEMMSDGSTTAQVDPLLLCRFLMAQCLSRNVHLHQPAAPLSIARTPTGALSHLTIQNTTTYQRTTLPCTTLVLAAGAWTPQVHRTLFPTSPLSLPITPLAGHSLLLRTPHWPSTLSPTPTTCHAIFTTDTTPPNPYAPELFSRLPHHTIYLAGLNTTTQHPLPPLPSPHSTHPESIQTLLRTARSLLGADIEVVRESVCWRPVGPGGRPVVARLGGEEEGVLVAAGHGAWGISGGVGTGWVVAGMVEGGVGDGDGDGGEWVGGLGV